MANKLIKLLFFIFLLCPSVVYSGTCWEDGGSSGSSGSSPWTVLEDEGGSESCAYADVNYCVNTVSSAGETVIIGAGSATWSSTLVIDKSLTLYGATTCTTSGTPGTSGYSISCNDGTKITGGGSNRLISISVGSDVDVEVYNLTLDSNSYSDLGGSIKVTNTSSVNVVDGIKIHNCEFENANYSAFTVAGMVFGVLYDCKFTNNHYDMKMLGDQGTMWSLYPGAANVGTANYFYVEDCHSTGNDGYICTSGEGARWAYRHNTLDVSAQGSSDQFLEVHGDTANRGAVAAEWYENYFSGGTSRGFDYRGGTVIIYNNTADMTDGTYEARITVSEEYDVCSYPSPGGDDCVDSPDWRDGVNNGYIWNNVNDYLSSNLNIVESDTYDHIAEKTNWWDDYDNDPEYFTEGLYASIPNSPSNGDCYWATDTEVLYRYYSSQWNQVYQPYTYPHPLRGGGKHSTGGFGQGVGWR